MGTTLQHGIFLPAEGERNCYTGLASNWTILDGVIGGYSSHAADLTIHVTAADKEAWNGKADASALTAHTGDTTIHVTSADKQAWNGHVADSVKHVTAEDKAKWDAVTSKANDSDVVHKSGNETVGGNKEFTGTTTAHDVIPSAIDTYNLGGPSYQWNNAYIKSLTINGVACGDILTHNVSEFVNVSSNQTIGGVKTFTSTIGIVKGSGDVELSIKNTALSLKTNTNSGMDDIRFIDKDDLIVGGLRQTFTNSKVTGMVYSRSYSSDGNSSTQTEFVLATDNQNGISDAYIKCNNFYPNANATINLGTSTNKWKTFNGVEPSSLSLPSDRSARIDISSYFTNTGTGQSNSYTVPANGYIYLTLSELTDVHCFSRTSGNVTNYAQTFTKLNNSTGALYVLFPVRKNDVFVATWYTTTTVGVDGAFFIPYQGNI